MNKRGYLPHNIYVRYDYPGEWENCGRQLYPIFQFAKFKDQYMSKCSLWKDRLVIDGKEFTTAPRSTLTELSQDLQPRNRVEKQNENVPCFYGVTVYSQTYIKSHSSLRVLNILVQNSVFSDPKANSLMMTLLIIG